MDNLKKWVGVIKETVKDDVRGIKELINKEVDIGDYMGDTIIRINQNFGIILVY